MVGKLLAGGSVVSALLFCVLSLTGLFAWDSLGETAPLLFWYGAIPFLGLSILLALALLAWAALHSDSAT